MITQAGERRGGSEVIENRGSFQAIEGKPYTRFSSAKYQLETRVRENRLGKDGGEGSQDFHGSMVGGKKLSNLTDVLLSFRFRCQII